MIAKTDRDKHMLRAAGTMLAEILHATAKRTLAGIATSELNLFAEQEIRARGALPVFLGYSEDGATPYPATLCVSINDEVVHAIPSEEKIVGEGDVVSLDLGLSYEGYVVDAAVTIIVGHGSQEANRLVRGTREALEAAVQVAHAGGHTGDIGAAVATIAKKYNLAVVRDLGGHGTGKELHETPFVANFGQPGEGESLLQDMVIAIEPIFTLNNGAIKGAGDGWTYKTKDHSLAAHFEHTVLIGEHGAEIVTQLRN